MYDNLAFEGPGYQAMEKQRIRPFNQVRHQDARDFTMPQPYFEPYMIHPRPRGSGPPNPYFQPEVEGGGQQQQYLEPQVNRRQIMNIIQEMYGPGLRRPDRPMFRSPYTPWMETIPIPRNYRIPEFTLFIEEERQSTIEHVGRFILQCGEPGYDDNLKLKLFSHSLSKVAFTWFIN